MQGKFRQRGGGFCRAAQGAVALAAGLCAAAEAAIDAQIVASKEQIQTFCGTTNVKLVFVNKPYLYYVDFSAATPAIVEVAGSVNAILPSISPDGRWIVYCKGPETDGNGGTPSSTYICQFSPNPTHVLVQANTAYEPRFVQNPTSGMEVIYSTQGGLDIWNGRGQLRKKDVTNGVVSATEQTVWAGGGYVGGISWDNRYVCTALQQARMLDLQNSGEGPVYLFDSIRFVNSVTGFEEFKALQCCNASVSSSRRFTNCMMHLDFGCINCPNVYVPYINNGVLWDQHDIIFITRYDDVVMRHYVEPGPVDVINTTDSCFDVPWNRRKSIYKDTQYDDPEWSNHPYYAAANLLVKRVYCRQAGEAQFPSTSNHEIIYLINLKDSTYLPVVRTTNVTATSTTNMVWPYVWIEVPAGFSEDSAWLAEPRIPNAIGRRTPAPGGHGLKLDIQDGRLVSAAALRTVRVYNVLGTVVEERAPAAGATVVPLGRRAPGIYFVQATDRDGQRSTLRWTVPR